MKRRQTDPAAALELAFIFLTDTFIRLKVINTRERIKSSTVNTPEKQVGCVYPFMQPTTFTDNNSVFFMFSGKRVSNSQAFHDHGDDDDDIHIQRFGKFWDKMTTS
ncbi:hypothetical protein JOB18_002914 [Solea senegalensis]|uniref:Uncharacterized protein n=1 Tax=Solea senegalensis TaxID=28829 RepID=A0AAV6SIP8_SOLSE|nr:hypothetical protein JOB18_002914 [Solea senegalensis]